MSPARPPLVDAVKRKSRAAAARCYADPFLPNAQTAVADRPRDGDAAPAGERTGRDAAPPRPAAGSRAQRPDDARGRVRAGRAPRSRPCRADRSARRSQAARAR